MARRTSDKSKKIKEIELRVHRGPLQLKPITIVGFCSICGNPLTKEFPAGFPEEWRWCCFCKLIAEWVIEDNLSEIAGYAFQKRISKIRKLITLVG